LDIKQIFINSYIFVWIVTANEEWFYRYLYFKIQKFIFRVILLRIYPRKESSYIYICFFYALNTVFLANLTTTFTIAIFIGLIEFIFQRILIYIRLKHGVLASYLTHVGFNTATLFIIFFLRGYKMRTYINTDWRWFQIYLKFN